MINHRLVNIYKSVKKRMANHRLPLPIRQMVGEDRKLNDFDPGCDLAIKEGIDWICRAQDLSKSNDGGVARHYSMIDGWSSSYPETTGYIIPTLLAYSKSKPDENLRKRARRMLDWLVKIQLPDGGFRGGTVNEPSKGPVTFNTGQILFGFCAGVHAFGDLYLKPLWKAADWLVANQDADGCWRKNSTPFASPGEKSYETHVAWSLLEAERIEGGKAYAEKAFKNIEWASNNVLENGWVEKCCLNDADNPLTHTLGYFLRGVIEGYKFKKDQKMLDIAIATATGLSTALNNDGYLPGRIDKKWKGSVKWSCLTGTVQVAYCWIELFRITGERHFWEAAVKANAYVRRTMTICANPGIRGGIKGSFPIDGEYGAFQFLNWACKFFIDANILEKTQKEQMANSTMYGNTELITN